MIQQDDKWKISIGTFLFQLAYILFLSIGIIGNTTFLEYISVHGVTLVSVLLCGGILIALKIICCDKISKKSILALLLLLILFILAYRSSAYVEILIITLLLLGTNGVRLDDIVKCHFVVYIVILAIAMLCASLGIIDNYSVYSETRGYRYALGNTYPTDFAAGTLYLFFDFAYIKRKCWKKKYSLFLLIIAFFVYKLTDARASFILSIVIAIGMVLCKCDKKIMLKKRLKYVAGIAYPLCAVVSVYIQSSYYKLNSNFLKTIDKMLNNRIAYGYMTIEKYGLSLTGKRIEMIGAGWNTDRSLDYLYVDNGYLQLAIMYGLLVLVFVSVVFMCICFTLDNNDEVLALIMLIIAISALIEPRFFYIIYNSFFLNIGIFLYNISRKQKMYINNIK